MKKQDSQQRVGVGVSSVLMILVVLAMTALSLLAFGSARPRTEERYDTGRHTTYFGHAQAILRMGTQDATLVVVDGSVRTQVTIVHVD
jgi:hypothetical protein